MNRRATGLFSCAPGRRERGRRADLPADRDPARGRHRGRLPPGGEPGAVLQRARCLPPHQPRDRGQRAQSAGGRRRALQETRSRDVRRHRGSGPAAEAAPQRVRRPVRGAAAGRGGQARHLRGRGPHDGGRAGRRAVNSTATLRDVTMRFREQTALDGVSLSIEQDSITGLLGRNGAGKTTLLQLLTGHRLPTRGSVEVFGAAPYENDAVLADIAFIKEGQRYPDAFRVRDALAAAAMVFPKWDDNLARQLVREFDLPEKRPVKKLSRGMNSAVGIIIGLASRAPLTLFDEPYLGLDAVARRLFYDRLLADYAEHPRTILLSTHLIEEIADLLEHVVLLDHGRIVLDTDAESLRGSAVTVTGPRDRVSAFAARHELLHTESLGGHSRAVVRLDGGMDAADAREAGLSWEQTTLQQLVVALSLHTAAAAAPAPSDDLEEVSR